MTEREKNIRLAEWMGHTVSPGWSDVVTYIVTGPATGREWNPCRCVADAMEIYERLAQVAPPVELVAGQWDGAAVYRLDIPAFLGPDCSTIPAAISEAVVEWIGEQP